MKQKALTAVTAVSASVFVTGIADFFVTIHTLKP